jgi:hypothetical protein
MQTTSGQKSGAKARVVRVGLVSKPEIGDAIVIQVKGN